MVAQRVDPKREEKTAADRKSSLSKSPKHWRLREYIMIFTMITGGTTAVNSDSIATAFQKLFSPITAEQFAALQKDISDINKTLNGNHALMVGDYKKMVQSGISFQNMASHLAGKDGEGIHENDYMKRTRIVSEFNIRIVPIQQSLKYLQDSQKRVEDLIFQLKISGK